jgi:PAS domain S-box-containing protein
MQLKPTVTGPETRAQPSLLRQIVAAAGLVALLTLAKLLLERFIDLKLPYSMYLAAVMGMAWYGGFRLGLATTLLSGALVHTLFVPPRGSFLKPDGANSVVMLFLAEGLLISYLTELLNRARREGELVGIEFRLLVDGTFQHCLVLLDPDGRIKSWNHGARKVLGYSASEIVERHLGTLFPIEEPTSSPHELISTASELGRAQVEDWCLRKDHSRFRAVLALTALRNTRGLISGFVLAIYDVTDRWRAETALQERERQLRQMANSLPVLLAFIDYQCRFIFTNDTYQRWFGEKPEECLGRHVREVLGDGPAALLESRLPQLVNDQAQTFETVVVHSGEPRNVLIDCIPHRSADGSSPGWYMLVADITQQKSVERALRAGEERLRSIVNTAVDAIITLDRRGMIESVNPAAERMFGHSSEEMVGQNIGLFLPLTDAGTLERSSVESARSTMRRMIKSGREVHAIRSDGSTFPVEMTISDVGSMGLFIGILRDVTQRMELEREVLEATAAEQRRIGQELHDHIGQELTGLELLVDTLAESVRGTESKAERLSSMIAARLRKTHHEIRGLARGLVPVEIHSSGLREALAQLASRVCEQGTACRFQAGGPVQVPDAAVATHMYRITQEAIANAIRHGHSNHIQIRLNVIGELLCLEIEDDGIGIEASPNRTAGLGLRLMEYRASLIGGQLSIEAGEAKGTKVTCRVPRKVLSGDKAKKYRAS